MTKKRGLKRPKVWVGGTPIGRISAKEDRELERRIKQRQEGLVYPEVHGNVVDFISHAVNEENQSNLPRVHLTAEI